MFGYCAKLKMILFLNESCTVGLKCSNCTRPDTSILYY